MTKRIMYKTIYVREDYTMMADQLLGYAMGQLPKESEFDIEVDWEATRCGRCGSADHLEEECDERIIEPVKDMDGGYYHAPHSRNEEPDGDN